LWLLVARVHLLLQVAVQRVVVLVDLEQPQIFLRPQEQLIQLLLVLVGQRHLPLLVLQ
jgi:hypothetical protein